MKSVKVMPRDVLWFVIHLTFYLFGQHIGLPDNLWHFLGKQTHTIFSLFGSHQSKPDNVTLILCGLKFLSSLILFHRFPQVVLFLWDSGRHQESSLHLQDS